MKKKTVRKSHIRKLPSGKVTKVREHLMTVNVNENRFSAVRASTVEMLNEIKSLLKEIDDGSGPVLFDADWSEIEKLVYKERLLKALKKLKEKGKLQDCYFEMYYKMDQPRVSQTTLQCGNPSGDIKWVPTGEWILKTPEGNIGYIKKS